MKSTNKLPYLSLAAIAAGCGCTDNRQPQQPNIILMMTDDHTTQALSCYRPGLVDTPNLDRLAEEGMLFNDCFVTNAISGPSRACILTGKYSHVNGFTDNSKTFDGSQQTFPKLLHDAGYQTAMIGKWHLNSDPQGFDHWSILVGQGEYYNPTFIENGVTRDEKGYVTDIITDKAISFIENRDKSRPFAMLYYHKAPHRNWIPAQRHLGMNENKVYPEPDNLLDDYSGRGRAAREQEMQIGRDMWPAWDLKLLYPEEFENVGALNNSGDANKDDVNRANSELNATMQWKAAYSRMTDSEKAALDAAYAPRRAEWRAIKDTASIETITRWKFQQYMKDYTAVITAVDENVGRLMAYLEKIGQLDNTIIIYTSDQGFFLGEHGWFDKRFMYDECHRTPLLVRYPRAIKAGSTTDAMALNIDLAPTLLDFAGVSIPEDIQGMSLKPVLCNEGREPEGWRDAVYYHYYEYPSWHSVKRHYGVRTKDHKLIHFYNDVDEWELYDLSKDPQEMHSVYGDPEYAGVKADLEAKMSALQQQYGDTDPTEQENSFTIGKN